ncbi:MAG TPA: FIST N-terminal domain-containing protein [Candidatus Limnocylindria bacterium]|nr:FIST N-terminal domain-containing protein [Candidatus Limnocylindria bacterium]
MFRMAVGHSDDIDVDAALTAVLAECDAALAGVAPTAGLLFAAWEADHQHVLDAVRSHYPGIALAGSSSGGEMTSVMGFQQDSIALAVFASDDIDITVGLGRNLAVDPQAVIREAVAGARAPTSQPPTLCIVMPTIGVIDASIILDGLRAELGPDVPIVGGGATARDPVMDPAATSGLQFANDSVIDGGIALLLFSGPLDYSFGVETGWRGVGPRATITRAGPGRVLEIDGRPAVEFFNRYVGTAPGQPPPIANPLAVFATPDATEFYLRTATALDHGTGEVAFFGSVPEGSTVQLTVAATDDILDGATASISDALARFPAGGTPGGALLYSCVVRRFLLGTRTGREMEAVQAIVGTATPVAGFYCMGEIAPFLDGGSSKFHNATMVSVLLGSHRA